MWKPAHSMGFENWTVENELIVEPVAALEKQEFLIFCPGEKGTVVHCYAFSLSIVTHFHCPLLRIFILINAMAIVTRFHFD